ncbi:MAG: hypothetical protein ACTHLE_04125 [Agriterribacter sp.]
MNKGLAHIILMKLADIPFIDLKAGLVYTQTQADKIFKDDEDEIGTRVEYRYPVSCDVIGNTNCDDQGLQALTPNSSKKGIMYIEDGGVTAVGSIGSLQRYESRLRIVVWLNTKNIDIPNCYSLTTPVMAGIIERLRGNPFNEGDYQRIDIRVSAIPRVNKELFAAYTYKESDTQYLMPPFEYFAIDLVIAFAVNPHCIDYIETKTPNACSN